MALTAKASERNADARRVLARFYRAFEQTKGLHFLIDMDDEEVQALGFTRDRYSLAIDRLVSNMLVERAGLSTFTMTSAGVDACEDDEALDDLLPVLRDAPAVPAPDILAPADHVARALSSAEAAIADGKPEDAIDRVHTALHGHVRELCRARGIALEDQAALPQAFSALWQQHPAGLAARPESEKIFRALGSIVETLNTLRNTASLSHPNPLPDRTDALLAISAARMILAYLDARFGATP